MKIAMPISEGHVSKLAVDCDRFTVVDVDLTENRILDSRRSEPEREWAGRTVTWLVNMSVDLIIAVEVSPEMTSDLIDAGIRLITGAQKDTPHSVIKSYLAGDLKQTNS